MGIALRVGCGCRGVVGSIHKGVCRLVTVVSQKRGRYIEDSTNSCLYDASGEMIVYLFIIGLSTIQ